MHLFHWGILAVFVGHVAGLIGGSLDISDWVVDALFTGAR